VTVRILQGDCRDVLDTLAENSVDSIVTDPPYHLTTAKKGGCGQASVNLETPFGRARIGTGFMGMKWDGGDVAFQAETWAKAMRVLKPGGFLVAFGGTRTFHRLVTAIEDAGFEVRDMLAWLYGSGFPKSTDKSKIPAEWAGWNTALKPAIEPICLARKPMEGTLAENLTKWGTGALWIDGCRIPLDGEVIDVTGCGAIPMRHQPEVAREGRGAPARDPQLGRWPANVMHDGSAEVLEAFPDAPGQMADASASASDRKTQNVYGAMRRGRGDEASADSENQGAVGFKMRPGARRLDTGSAARFFYCAKASKADRNDGCDCLPLKASGMVSNTSGQHITRLDGGAPAPTANHHPTVKPTDLMRYACKLVTPPAGHVLDLFTGSGSTGRGAVLEGFSFTGIELDRDGEGKPIGYIAIATARIAAAQQLAAEEAAERKVATAQTDLFASVEVPT
jgi:DNA modification methylase